jgi:hypothetical protein
MNRDFKEYSVPYELKQGPSISKYPDLSSYKINSDSLSQHYGMNVIISIKSLL